MKTTILILTTILFLTGISIKTVQAQTPVTDVGAGIQREALWERRKAS